jgi:hypothetical protein
VLKAGAKVVPFRRVFLCDVCGREREGAPKFCRRCCLNVCAGCDVNQAGVGHLAAEHGHEVQREAARW